MNTQVEDVLEMAKTWPTEDQAELLDALFGLVSPTGGANQWGQTPLIRSSTFRSHASHKIADDTAST